MDQNRQIKAGAILSYFAIFLNIFAGLFYIPWIKNHVGIEQYGLYTLSNSIITLFLVDFGLSSAVTRYLSKYRAEGDDKKAAQFLGAVYKLYFYLDLFFFVVFTIVYFLIDQIYIKLSPQELTLFKGVYIISAAFALINFPYVTHNGILTSYEKFIQLKLADIIYRILVVVTTVATLSAGGGLYALVTCNALSGLASILFKFFVIRKSIPLRADFTKTDKSIYKEIFGFSLWVTVSTIAHRLVFNIVPSILGIVANSAAIAVFGVVSTIEGYSYLVTSAINGMFMPRISRIYANGNDQREFMPLMLKVGRFQFALNSLIVVGFTLLGRDFVTLWMGKEFEQAYIGTLLILIPAMFFNALQIANTAMVVQKRVKLQAVVNLIMGGTSVVLSLILSPKLGALGACIAIFSAYAVRLVIIMTVYHKVMKVDIPLFIRRCYLKTTPTLIISLVIGKFLCSFLSLEGWIGLCVKGVAVVLIFGVSFVLTGLESGERKRIFVRIKKQKNLKDC